MTESTKKQEVEKPKKDRNIKGKINGLYGLIVALTELASTYVFVTQDTSILYPLAIILGVDSAIRFTKAFVK